MHVPPQLAGAVTRPVWPVADGKCACGVPCTRPFKHPRTWNGRLEGQPYAVTTGASSGVFVLDVDVKGGVDGFAELAAMGFELPPTFVVGTPTKGAHLYFRHPGFHVGNHKLGLAIDVRGDEENQYVIGPGSPGGTRAGEYLGDYVVTCDAPIAQLSDDHPLLGWLRAHGEPRPEAFTAEALTEDHPDYERHIALGEEAARTMPPSQADGQAGTRLLALCIRLVRGLRLPLEDAGGIILEHFNPRCTTPEGEPYPWEEEDILHKLEDARDNSAIPVGLLASTQDAMRSAISRVATKPALRDLPQVQAAIAGARERRRPRADHRPKYIANELAAHPSAGKVSFAELVTHFTRHADWDGVWQFDCFADRLVAVDPPLALDAQTKGLTEGDLHDLRAYLEHVGVIAQEKDIRAAISVAGRGRSFHPVREYLLDALPAGDPEMFVGLASRLFGDTSPHAEDFLRKTLVAAVRRILVPGCQVDTVLILHGPEQGEGKTKAVEALFSQPWTKRGLPPDLGNRDAKHALRSKWAIELGELAALLRTEKNAAKDFISNAVDEYRQYGNGDDVIRPRQCVFIGTTNDDDFLRDATGNRRYWIISIPPGWVIPLDWITENRDAIWAAALTLARQWSELPGSTCTRETEVRHWYVKAEELALRVVREPFVEHDPWHEKIAEQCTGRDWVSSVDIARGLGLELAALDQRTFRRITDELRKLGCRSNVVRGGRKGWGVPPALSGVQPATEEAMRRKLAEHAARLKRPQ